jgi:hypothetical protein
VDKAAPASVYVKKNMAFCGTNFTERRVVESWMIQAFGKVGNSTCEQCQEDKGVYYDCRTLQGFADGACGNCKRGDRATLCSKTSAVVEKKASEVNENLQDMQQAEDRATRAGRRALIMHPVEGYSADNPQHVKWAATRLQLGNKKDEVLQWSTGDSDDE